MRIGLMACAAAAALAIAGCAPVSTAPVASDSWDYAAHAASALAHPGRLAGDSENDARRHAAETLAFFQVSPGDTVFEMEAGGGYWTELLSATVGPEGQVVMQNPEGFRRFVGEAIAQRFTPGRLANVRQSWTMFEPLDAADASVDVVTWVQGPHELYYTPQPGVNLGDPARSYAEIFRILKPGGAFVVVDHSAIDGSPSSTGNDLHRIDPAIVIQMAQAAGFTLEARGEFLRNPADPRTANVFDESIRGHTDQFALRFRKPT